MKLRIKKNLKKFVDIVKIVESLCLETDFVFLNDKIIIRIVHPSNHSLSIFELDKKMFDEYDGSSEEVCTLNTSEFNKIVKRVGKKEMEIELKDSILHITNSKDKFKFKYYVGKKDGRPLPDVKFITSWNIDTNELFTIINDLSDINDVCSFIDDDKLHIKVKGILVEGETIISAKKINGEMTSCYYDLTYLSAVSGIKNLFKNIELKFGEDVPCYIKGSDDEINFEWFLAPRVE